MFFSIISVYKVSVVSVFTLCYGTAKAFRGLFLLYSLFMMCRFSHSLCDGTHTLSGLSETDMLLVSASDSQHDVLLSTSFLVYKCNRKKLNIKKNNVSVSETLLNDVPKKQFQRNYVCIESFWYDGLVKMLSFIFQTVIHT